MTRKQLVICLIVSVLAIGALGTISHYQKKESSVRYGGQYYPGEFLLKGKPDLWGELDIEHLLFSSGSENNKALLSGDIDINVGSDSKTAALCAVRDDIVILGTIQRGDRYSTIVRADSEYESWYDLKGKIVGTRLGTGAEQVLLRYFDLIEDLSWDDYEWVNVKVEDMTLMLESGQIEAFTAWEPTPAIAEARGIGKVLKSYGDVALVPVSIHTTREYADSHEKEIVEFMQAHRRKVDLIETEPYIAAQLAANAASESGVDVPAMAFYKIFERVDFSLSFDDMALEALEDTAHFLYEKGKIEKLPSFVIDGSYLEKSLRDK